MPFTSVHQCTCGSSPRLRGTLLFSLFSSSPFGIIPALAGNTCGSGVVPPASWDHPRACGEHELTLFDNGVALGSSPRLRGTRKREVAAWRGVGIIPALAGNTRRRCRTGHRAWDHPRACGEHLASLDQQRFDRGSSPRLRGTQTLERVCASGRGIIPALAGNTDGLTLAGIAVPGSSPRLRGTLLRSGPATPPCGIIPALAGNTLAQSWPQALGSDHPRACGEHITVSHGDIMEAGSSPRLRGTQVRDWPRNILRGIIPALAGNTQPQPQSSHRYWDHPRACGEHERCAVTVAAGAGSSPRLRGTPEHYAVGSHSEGIIPALAGNTHARFVRPYRRRDHPRACGEHVTVPQDAILTAGSSPRLRGTRVVTEVLHDAHGIIPALAGNTPGLWRRFSRSSNHPRACREHSMEETVGTLALGSSPRLRGTRPRLWLRCRRGGIIPALAGNTHMKGDKQ